MILTETDRTLFFSPVTTSEQLSYDRSVEEGRVFRWLLVAFLIVIGMLAFLGWLIVGPHTPDLPPKQAVQLISDTPEFNRNARLVTIASTTRGTCSLNDCCYFADFTFVSNGSTAPVPARAEFRYWNGSWHLSSFSYGAPP